MATASRGAKGEGGPAAGQAMFFEEHRAMGDNGPPSAVEHDLSSLMITKHLFRSPLHQHADPAQRVLGASVLSPDSDELARLLTADPVPEVRAAAASRCTDIDALGAAWRSESDPAVRTVLAAVLGQALAETLDNEGATALLESDECTDAIRAEVARRAQDADRRRVAIAALRGEDSLVAVALEAEQSEARLAAAQRVHSPDGLRKLADAARNKDHGVARLARKRIEAIADRVDRTAEADALLAQMEALAIAPGPILTTLVEINRRWEALDIGDDVVRIARSDAARRALQARFDREHDEQRTRTRFERRLNESTGMRDPPASQEALTALREELGALREEAVAFGDRAWDAKLDDAERRVVLWTQELQARADAEALVTEAEQLAGGTSIDDANLPARWQALNRDHRTPLLTRRFEAALIVVEQRRLAQIHAAGQEANAARQKVHGLLHAAEQALAAGEVQAARAAADAIRLGKSTAGPLPRPTTQRLSRLIQQLAELERWESFGQQHARIQLCERAEAAMTAKLDAPRLAAEVQKLRDEWKALDLQYRGVPAALWQRFDRACEKAYAPAARYFAEMAAQQREARQRRDGFIAAAEAHAATLLPEPRDWRAIEHWLRETDRAWRDGDLGSVEPKAWRGFDARYKATVKPLRDALAGARVLAMAGRQTLIDEALALAGKAMERDVPSQVKAIQARWQAQAKGFALPQRDERALWERFRAACNAVFDARQAKRREADGVKHQQLRGLEAICAGLEQLAVATDKTENDIRRGLRDLEQQWKTQAGGFDPALRGVESRFRNAKTAIEAALSGRARSRETAVWQALAAKERLCEELDVLVRTTGNRAEDTMTAAASERWATLPPLPPAWEKKMLARRDAALRALSEESAAAAFASRIEHGAESRRDILLELEISLGLESPAELKARRLALQVNQLKQRFQNAATPGGGPAGERLLAWCAESGIADARDRERCQRVFSAIEKAHSATVSKG
jgi:exonuclease SbcC